MLRYLGRHRSGHERGIDNGAAAGGRLLFNAHCIPPSTMILVTMSSNCVADTIRTTAAHLSFRNPRCLSMSMQAASFSEQRWIKPVGRSLYLPQRERYATTCIHVTKSSRAQTHLGRLLIMPACGYIWNGTLAPTAQPP